MYIRKILYATFYTLFLFLGFNSLQITTKYTDETNGITHVFKEKDNKGENKFCKSIFQSSFFNAAQIWHSNRIKIFNASHHKDLQNVFKTLPDANGSLSEEGKLMHKIFFDILTVSCSID